MHRPRFALDALELFLSLEIRMRRLGLTLIATAAAITLAGCGKSSSNAPNASAGQAAARTARGLRNVPSISACFVLATLTLPSLT